MKTALIYDEVSPAGVGSWVEVEYESPETIEALLAAIEAHCRQAVAIPFGPSLLDDLAREAPDLVFNIAEGREGPWRESVVPVLLDHLGIPYTGSGGVALGISLDKALTKRLAVSLGVPTPSFRLFASGDEARLHAGELDYPVLLKPNFGGSSVGVGAGSIVQWPACLPERVQEQVDAFAQPCLAERYVPGVDVTVGLLGNRRVRVFPPARIETARGMYSEAVKQRHDRRVVCPCELPRGLADRLAEWSLEVYRTIGARDFARVDFMLDEQGRAHFLEINPLPGLSPFYGVYPVLAQEAGYGHRELIGAIMKLALERCSSVENRTHGQLAR